MVHGVNAIARHAHQKTCDPLDGRLAPEKGGEIAQAHNFGEHGRALVRPALSADRNDRRRRQSDRLAIVAGVAAESDHGVLALRPHMSRICRRPPGRLRRTMTAPSTTWNGPVA